MEKEQRFIPCYNKKGRWYYLDEAVSYEKCAWWYKRELIKPKTLTYVIPYNCNYCPKLFLSIYAKYKLSSLYYPIKKKEF